MLFLLLFSLSSLSLRFFVFILFSFLAFGGTPLEERARLRILNAYKFYVNTSTI